MSKEIKRKIAILDDSGKLVKIPQFIQKHINQIEKRWFEKMKKLDENYKKQIHELEHRLANCIELPKGIDVGNTVYYVTGYCNEEGDELYEIEVGLVYWIEKALKVTNIAFDKNGKLKETYDGFNYTIYVRYESGLIFQHGFEDVGVWLFATEEEAKAKLEELKNG